jgi:phage baseplate assembly protein W
MADWWRRPDLRSEEASVASPNRDFLGIGWKFPLQVTPGGRIAQARYEQRIEESIFLILSTSKGERPMLPDFGCGIHDLVFAPNNAVTLSQVVVSVRKALTAYEPRIDLLDVSTESPPGSDNLLLIRIEYRIRANNAVGNLVYPFYIREVA